MWSKKRSEKFKLNKQNLHSAYVSSTSPSTLSQRISSRSIAPQIRNIVGTLSQKTLIRSLRRWVIIVWEEFQARETIENPSMEGANEQGPRLRDFLMGKRPFAILFKCLRMTLVSTFWSILWLVLRLLSLLYGFVVTLLHGPCSQLHIPRYHLQRDRHQGPNQDQISVRERLSGCDQESTHDTLGQEALHRGFLARGFLARGFWGQSLKGALQKYYLKVSLFAAKVCMYRRCDKSKGRGACALSFKRVKVISVGNIAAGGRHKTPLVAAVQHYLQSKDIAALVVVKGYGAPFQGPGLVPGLVRGSSSGLVPNRDNDHRMECSLYGDEACQLVLQLGEGAVAVAKDRSKALSWAEEKGYEVVIFDDALHCKEIPIDLHIVSIKPSDLEAHFLPLGPLRLPRSMLRHADVLSIMGKTLSVKQCAQAQRFLRKDAETFFFQLTPAALVVEGGDRSIQLQIAGRVPSSDLEASIMSLLESARTELLCDEKSRPGKTGKTLPLREKIEVSRMRSLSPKIYLYCAISAPERFFASVENLAISTVGRRCDPDHYTLSDKELAEWIDEIKDLGVDLVITTEKDRPRLDVERLKAAGIFVAYLSMKLHFFEAAEPLLEAAPSEDARPHFETDSAVKLRLNAKKPIQTSDAYVDFSRVANSTCLPEKLRVKIDALIGLGESIEE